MARNSMMTPHNHQNSDIMSVRNSSIRKGSFGGESPKSKKRFDWGNQEVPEMLAAKPKKRKMGQLSKDDLEKKIIDMKKKINKQKDTNTKALAKQVKVEETLDNLKKSKANATVLSEKFDIEKDRLLNKKADSSNIKPKGHKYKNLQ
jgi:hypothetical protein